MRIDRLTLEDFRNFRSAQAEFEENVNVIIGDNAQGKTNLLESVYYLACGKSFRAKSDRDVIRLGAPSARIAADIFSGGREQKLEARLFAGARKQLYANGAKLRTAGELSGRLSAVLFSPDDLYLIKDGAPARRRLMDMCISQLRPRYAQALSKFSRLYDGKTRILRDWREKPSLLDMLDEYNDSLCRINAELIWYRAHFVKRLSATADEVHAGFTGGGERLSMRYVTVKTIDDPEKRPEELLPALLEHQRTHRQAELDSGLCLSGSHKDELEIEINGRSARSFASQGQTRTAALSVKLAERRLHFDETGEYPVLLLDDVLSELDPGRQSFVLNRITDGQVFITCCEDGNIAEKTGGRIIRVTKGELG